jgi:hypothetical protein
MCAGGSTSGHGPSQGALESGYDINTVIRRGNNFTTSATICLWS